MLNNRLAFNENVLNYDKWRPTYCSEMFKDILAFSQIDKGSKVMEVGIGTGQATRPFLEVGCDVTAVEIGADLAEYARAKYREYSNLSVEQVAFEDASYPAESIDLLYSATAFHWIPEDIGYSKAASLLKPNGTLALFWNRPFVSRPDDDVHQAIRRIYQTYRPTTEQLVEHDTEKYEARVQAIEAYGFKDVTCKLYHRTRVF
ncbi:class I SAM-dependent methyltransferase [Paenalkalicoccus suaedae]|uniref:class I SAM-dependent methyltransferase n=1 Tax=Paenalkalicoccus suaedae TaxID=2592382 RepID=UPI001C37D982|nr:class I SAM-dependent methyltransferase [Paenalkalicoccus suaedae]